MRRGGGEGREPVSSAGCGCSDSPELVLAEGPGTPRPGAGARTDRRPRAGGGATRHTPGLCLSPKEDVRFPQVSEPTDRDLRSGPRSGLALQHCKTRLHYVPQIHLFPLSNANLTN